MMKKKTVRLISCIIAGILVAAMVFSMIASGLVYAGAVSSKELKSKLSDLEDQKTSVKAELDSLAGKVDEVAKTRAALQKEIKLTKEEITTVTAYIDRLQDQIDVKTTELDAAIKALDSKKGQDIKCLETGHLTTLADYFVLCTATSTTQIKALADVCEKTLKDAGEPPHHVEGHRGGTWILLDFSSVVVHIFNEEAREFYDLERLWSDAAPVDLSGVLTEN